MKIIKIEVTTGLFNKTKNLYLNKNDICNY